MKSLSLRVVGEPEACYYDCPGREACYIS